MKKSLSAEGFAAVNCYSWF